MDTRNRTQPPVAGTRHDANGSLGTTPRGREQRDATTRLVSEADRAIDDVLTGDSERYLGNMGQQSGQ